VPYLSAACSSLHAWLEALRVAGLQLDGSQLHCLVECCTVHLVDPVLRFVGVWV
jgi:hypothetical protein